MNKKLVMAIGFCAAFSLLQIHCGKKKTDVSHSDATSVTTTQESTPEGSATPSAVNENGIVCIWDGVPVRTEPKKAGKYISSISLGETVKFLGKSETDPGDKNREYLNVQLSDGKEGWAPTYGLVQEASTGVVKADASIYKRPDLLTITNTKFSPMEFIAVINTKDDWVEVVSEQKKKSGWIKKDAISLNKEDVAMSIFINKKLAQNDGLSINDKYKTIIAEAPYPSSIFIENIKKQLESEAAADMTTDESSVNTDNESNTASENAATTDESSTDETQSNEGD